LLPVCSAVFGGFIPAVALAVHQAAFGSSCFAETSSPKQANAFAADAVPVELWVTRLRYP